MKMISTATVASALALSALAFSAAPTAAQVSPIVPPGRYCISYAGGGTDCSFTSYAQCGATAFGQDAECYGNTIRDDERSRGW
jgi:hypothetical protein